MYWGTERFDQVYEALNASIIDERPDPRLQTLIEAVSDDLKNLFDTPKRSDASRTALSKQTVKFDDGVEYKLSTEFVNAAAQVADELNIDELAAAQIVYNASFNSKKLNITHAEAAVALFYTRRQYIVNIVLFIVEQAATQPHSLYNKLLPLVLDGKPGTKILDTLKSVEQGLADLQEKVKRGQFLGLDKNAAFVQTTTMQRDFLAGEHQKLCALLYEIVRNNLLDNASTMAILEHTASFTTYDDYILNYLTPLVLYFSLLDSLSRQSVVAVKSGISPSDSNTIFKYLVNESKNNDWKLSWWRGLLTTSFLAFYSGYIAEHPDQGMEQHSTLLSALRPAIDNGGLEGLMAIAQDVATSSNHPVYNDFSPLVRTRVPKLTTIAHLPSDLLVERLHQVLELFLEAFVSNFADILQEMRLNEEDTYLALSTAGTAEAKSLNPGRDLERFFLFVAYLYDNRPDASLPLWTDPEGSMYGFLVWASHSQAAFMSATFTEMLASLSCSPESASYAHKLLSETSSTNSKPAFTVSWDSIRAVLIYYVKGMEPQSKSTQPDDNSTGLYSGPQFGQDTSLSTNGQSSGGDLKSTRPNALDDETLLLLFSYLRLIFEIARHSDGARDFCWLTDSDTKRSIVSVLFDFLRFQTPLYAPLFLALSSFATDDNKDGHNDSLWKLLDEWAFEKDITSPEGAIIYSQGKARFDQLLTTAPDALGLLTLLRRLFSVLSPTKVASSRHLKDYTKFVITEVFVLSSKTVFPSEERPLFQQEALGIIDILLNPLGGDLSRVKRLGLNGDNLLENATISEYLDHFPYELAQEYCFHSSVYETLFSIMATGVDIVDPLPANDVLVSILEASIRVVTTLLQDTSKAGLRFDKPLLYNLHVIPHLFLYASSEHLPIALASVKLLQAIAGSSVFTASPSRQNRVLSILESVTESSRIKLGFTRQLEREETSANESALLFELKLAILDLLACDLGHSTGYTGPGVGHYLLGFHIHGDGSLKLDSKSANGIGSGSSLFDTVCALLELSLNVNSSEVVGVRASEISDSSSQVLLHLIQNPLSSKLVLDYLRPSNYLLRLLRNETVVNSQTWWESETFETGFQSQPAGDAFVHFFRHRAALIEMLSLEVHVVASSQLLSLLSQYLDLLMNLQHDASKSVLSFLDFMKFGIDNFIPPLPADADSNVARLFETKANAHEELVTVLKSQKYDAQHLKETVDIYTHRHLLLQMKASQLSCLQAWCQLVPVIVNDSPQTNGNYSSTFVLETIQTLVPKLVYYAQTDTAFCEPLASLLVLLLERYQESTTVDIAASDRLHSLFQAAVCSIQMSVSSPALRADLYAICYQSLTMVLASNDFRQYKQKLELIHASGDRLLQTICWDALNADLYLRLGALIFIQVLVTVAKKSQAAFIEEKLLRFNLAQLLIESVKSLDTELPTVGEAQPFGINVIKVTFSLLLQLAQTRAGADNLLQGGLLDMLTDTGIVERESAKQNTERQKTYSDVVILIFQLLAAVLVSMGPENARVINAIKALLVRYENVSMNILRADASSRGLTSDSELGQFADTIALLYTITGYTPPQYHAATTGF